MHTDDINEVENFIIYWHGSFTSFQSFSCSDIAKSDKEWLWNWTVRKELG